MKGLETNHEAQWALEKTESLCCSQSAAPVPKISYFQHVYKKENSDMTSFGGIITCFRKHPLGSFIIYRVSISAFHLGLLTMC